MKIAIISDSHRKTTLTQQSIDHLKSKGAQYIIHAGDLEIKENLDILKNSGLIYVAVFGNNDYNLIQYQNQYKINKEPYYFTIKNIKFKLMHIPAYLTPETDIVIFGHTHIFEHQYKAGTLYLNPGEICAREKDLTESVLLEITNNKYIINRYFKKPSDDIWNHEIFEYEREQQNGK